MKAAALARTRHGTQKREAKATAAEAAEAAKQASEVDGADDKSNSHARAFHSKLGAHFGHRGERDAKLAKSSLGAESKAVKASLGERKVVKPPAYEAKLAKGLSKVAAAQAKVRACFHSREPNEGLWGVAPCF
jgi:hypothetical protein